MLRKNKTITTLPLIYKGIFKISLFTDLAWYPLKKVQ